MHMRSFEQLKGKIAVSYTVNEQKLNHFSRMYQTRAVIFKLLEIQKECIFCSLKKCNFTSQIARHHFILDG